MRAEKSFGRLAVTTATMIAIIACAPIVRREGQNGGAGGAGGITGEGGITGFAGFGTGLVRGTGGVGTGGTMTTVFGLGGTTSTVCGFTTSYGWASTQSIMDPVSDGSHSLVGIKSPSVVRFEDKYHVFATVVDEAGKFSMQYAKFSDWQNMPSATVDFLDNNPGFSGQQYQPQVFYFSPKKTWYLISQASGPFYSTNADITQARDWSAPKAFYSSTPSIVTKNAGSGGIGWTDFWIICDSTNCHMFFTNTLGYVFRSQTSVGNFPNGFGEPVLAMPQNSYLREGGRIYKIKGADKYVMTIEGYGSGGRYIGVWSATALDGSWSPMAETESNPFASANRGNVTFAGAQWTKDAGHGELVRDSYDETMTIDNCNMRYLYAGKDPFSSAKTEPYPWRLGLLVRSK
jgi:endo-1,4-beta-xylanase